MKVADISRARGNGLTRKDFAASVVEDDVLALEHGLPVREWKLPSGSIPDPEPAGVRQSANHHQPITLHVGREWHRKHKFTVFIQDVERLFGAHEHVEPTFPFILALACPDHRFTGGGVSTLFTMPLRKSTA